jgi:glutamate-1-semialdehyde 2,1-aminomutase
MALAHAIRRDWRRLDEFIAEQERLFLDRQPKSAAMLERARFVLAGGVTSSWQIARPQPVWLSHGEGSKIVDVDGNEYIDLHGGYGVMAVGHAHPKIVKAVSDRIARGSHFAQPTEDAIAVAEELSRRFGLPRWRFANSGTEATMDAVHLMRAATGRDLIVKVEGTYHGHHDSVQVSVYQEPPDIGPADEPKSVPAGAGIPDAIINLTLVVPYNDLDAVRRVFDATGDRIAGMILEPIMMNAGIIPPDDGYLQGLREITADHRAFLAFDEVKTGITTAPGGATELFDITPDLVCLAKAMGGGLPCGALGGTAKAMEAIESGVYEQVGTFNGNPLTVAAARAALTEILTAEAYAHFTRLRTMLERELRRTIDEFALPAYVTAFGAKGCIVFSERRVRNYRDFLEVDDRFSHAHWLWQHNNGVFLPPWGKSEQWMLSVQHTAEDVRRFIDNFRTFSEAVVA